VTEVCRMCDVNVSILWFLGSRQNKVKSVGRFDREGLQGRKGLRLILTVWDLKSVEGFPREGFRHKALADRRLPPPAKIHHQILAENQKLISDNRLDNRLLTMK
jgi:hypothetical protein